MSCSPNDQQTAEKWVRDKNLKCPLCGGAFQFVDVVGLAQGQLQGNPYGGRPSFRPSRDYHSAALFACMVCAAWQLFPAGVIGMTGAP
jgi:hypothetical protein